MKTRVIDIKNKSRYASYFHEVTMHTKALRNTANFYIRNTRSGLSKSPEERTANEVEVLHNVFTGIQKANEDAVIRLEKKIRQAEYEEGLTGHAMMIKAMKKFKLFSYPTRENWMLSYYQLDAIFKCTNNPVYYALPAQVNQQAIKKTVSSWKGYFKSLNDWKKDPSKYTGKPHIPGYIREQTATAHFTNQVLKPYVSDGKLMLSFPNSNLALCVGSGISASDLVKAEVKVLHRRFRILVTYKSKEIKLSVPLHPKKILGVDVGVDNLFACAGNYEMAPFLIDGHWLKSINQWFNKERARLLSALTSGMDSTVSVKDSKHLDTLSRKREAQMKDFFYKAAHEISKRCKDDSVDVIVIGYNPDIKQSPEMGAVNNQNFISIPQKRAIDILVQVSAEYGIPAVVREESYTSKASCLDFDEIPTYGSKDSEAFQFSGCRVKRGLYRAKDGSILNADINGAANILRKEYPDAFSDRGSMKHLTDTLVRITREELCHVKATAKQSKHRKMSDARKINRREHRYKQRMYEKLFTGKSRKKFREEQKQKAIEKAKHKAV